MLRYQLLLVGRRARDPLLESLDDYFKRLNRYVPTQLVRIKEGSLETEAKAIGHHLTASDRIVVLDERGISMTTQALVSRVAAWHDSPPARTSFIVGGADGTSLTLRNKAHFLWALGPMTLPHRLAHVVLAEQLYRVHTVLRGEKYHRVGLAGDIA